LDKERQFSKVILKRWYEEEQQNSPTKHILFSPVLIVSQIKRCKPERVWSLWCTYSRAPFVLKPYFMTAAVNNRITTAREEALVKRE